MKQVKIDPLNVNCLRYFKILQCAPTLLAHTLVRSPGTTAEVQVQGLQCARLTIAGGGRTAV